MCLYFYIASESNIALCQARTNPLNSFSHAFYTFPNSSSIYSDLHSIDATVTQDAYTRDRDARLHAAGRSLQLKCTEQDTEKKGQISRGYSLEFTSELLSRRSLKLFLPRAWLICRPRSASLISRRNVTKTHRVWPHMLSLVFHSVSNFSTDSWAQKTSHVTS